jgi:D-glycero-beta-D-manno-heptose 1-phosphate adenylyltransferase
MYAEERVLPLDELLGRLAPDRLAGRQVVFTNGCFDLLHAGHAALLERAAAQGEILVVGLNSDVSVRRLKGPRRPIVPERERAALLASLRAVDYVVLFDEETPLRLITALRPDVLVKGEDYAEEQIVGREVVEAHGGRVVRVPLVAGLSTSNLLDRVRRLWNEDS